MTTTPGALRIAAVLENFKYYDPCGNTSVVVAGTTYYPVLEEHLAEIDEERYESLIDQAGPNGVVRVAPPGPGDDIGTMVVYTDGMARFESDSGITEWLTDQQQQYNWEC